MLFNLRSAFVSILHAKEILKLAQDNLAYYDRVLEVNRTRRQAGDISEVDLGRLELQRVQYESDLQNRGRELAHGQDSTVEPAERSHADRAI